MYLTSIEITIADAEAILTDNNMDKKSSQVMSSE